MDATKVKRSARGAWWLDGGRGHCPARAQPHHREAALRGATCDADGCRPCDGNDVPMDALVATHDR